MSEMLERWKEAIKTSDEMKKYWESKRQEYFDFNGTIGDLYGQVVRELDVLRGLEFYGKIFHHNSITLYSDTTIPELVDLIGHDYNVGVFYTRANIMYIQRERLDGGWNNLAIRAWFHRNRTEILLPWSINAEEIKEMLDRFGFTITHFEPTEIEAEYREHMTTQDFIKAAKEFDEDLEVWKPFLTKQSE